MAKKHSSRGIHILRDSVARKIAAGEVIDRPFSVVRELLDNAIDAQSTDISLVLEKGGTSRIRIIDNGTGMSKEDMKICFLPHATSKIHDVEDIYKIHTLGFRGEALSAIGTCSHMEIISKEDRAPYGHRLCVHGGKQISLEEYKSKKGTIVDVSALFYNMPGRKKFLKSVSGETYMCTSTFLEKALPFPEISFKMTVNGKIKHIFPPETLLNRVVSIFKNSGPADAFEHLSQPGEDFTINIIAARPEVFRKDKKNIHIYINKRRVFEYACIQALEYGYSGYMPGNSHPIASVFIDISPELVDFNIHPAKRECKIRILPQIHQGIVSLVKSFVNKFSISIKTPNYTYEDKHNRQLFDTYQVKETGAGTTTSFDTFAGLSKDQHKTDNQSSTNLKHHLNKTTIGAQQNVEHLYAYLKEKRFQTTESPGEKEKAGETTGSTGEVSEEPRYIGEVFGLFLVAEYEDRVYIIDKHAAHERLLYEELRAAPPVMQELLFPVSFDVTDKEEEYITSLLPRLAEQGIRLEHIGNGCFELNGLPAHFHSIDSRDIIDCIKQSSTRVDDLEHKLNSMAACRNALKDGDYIDQLTAQQLIRQVFLLDNARCPHGRPIWHVISRDQLFSYMGRT